MSIGTSRRQIPQEIRSDGTDTHQKIPGFVPVVEAAEGHLIGGRKVHDGPVFERFSDALYVISTCRFIRRNNGSILA
jgi:hypothetical protein